MSQRIAVSLQEQLRGQLLTAGLQDTIAKIKGSIRGLIMLLAIDFPN